MKNSFQRNLLLGFGFSIFCLIISSVASYKSIKNLIQSFDWVDHTNIVDQRVGFLMSSLVDAETGMRGYLLNGDQSFLQPYYLVKDSLIGEVNDIASLTADNPIQRRNCRELRNSVDNNILLISTLIQRKAAGATLNEDSLALGKQYMDRSRVITDRMKGVENRLLIWRKASVDKSTTFSLIFIMLASLIAIAVSIVFYLKTIQNIDDNQQLHDELIKKEIATNKQIDIIQQHADKIASGDYSARLDLKDLKDE